jgi:hypothetical protein
MRIEFANAARDGLAWTGPLLRIGQAADNDLVLDDAGVAAHHLSLRRMPGTLVLEVEPGAGRVYVNARPVHERALLRAGDSLGVGKCRLRLCAEATVADDDDAETPEVPLTVALRAVAGPLSGRVMPLDDRLELGPRGHFPLDLPHEAGLPEDTAGPRGEVWWLIVTAAVLGLAIALLLFVRF